MIFLQFNEGNEQIGKILEGLIKFISKLALRHTYIWSTNRKKKSSKIQIYIYVYQYMGNEDVK